MEQLHTAWNLNITDYAKDLSITLSRGEGTMCISENRIISRSKDQILIFSFLTNIFSIRTH